MKRFVISSLMMAALAASGMQAGEIRNREANQQERIAQGVGSGELTARQTGRLETKEANLNREVAADRSRKGGNLTDNQRRRIERQQNVLSRDIYRDKR